MNAATPPGARGALPFPLWRKAGREPSEFRWAFEEMLHESQTMVGARPMFSPLMHLSKNPHQNELSKEGASQLKPAQVRAT